MFCKTKNFTVFYFTILMVIFAAMVAKFTKNNSKDENVKIKRILF